MSTKIYEGLKLRDSTIELFDLIPQLASAIEKAYAKLAKELVFSHIANMVDDKKFRESAEPDDLIFFHAEDHWRKVQNELGPRHTLNDPLRFSIVFGRSSAGNVLALPFYRENAYSKALKGLKIFDSYGYWNNSDRPRGISEANWEKRKDEWLSLENSRGTYSSLPHWSLPDSQEPFSLVLIERPKFDMNRYASQERRQRRLLVEALTGELYRRFPEEENKFRFYFAAGRVVNDFLETEEAANVPLPEPLPIGLGAKFKDLPPEYKVSEEILEKLCALSDFS